jgi:putative redox protein
MAGEKTTSAHVRETGESVFAVEINVSGHIIKGDEPVDGGGANLGPSPYDVLLAALGECTAMTVRWYARQQNWPLEDVQVTLTHRKTDAASLPEAQGRTGKVDLFEKIVEIHGDELTDQQKQKLIDVAAKCPVHRTLQSNPIIHTASA